MNVPDRPMSYIDLNHEEDLWKWMDSLEKAGMHVIAIPHNSNASKGRMFPDTDSAGDSFTVQYAEMRSRFEPLVEMMQIKGNSEVHRSFWAVTKGLAYQNSLGVNPFHYGFVGGTDNHDGLMSNVAEDNFAVGSHGAADNSVEKRRTGEVGGWIKGKDLNPGALTGVWAPENTREAIWDGLKARETFATSGPRIKVRFFGQLGPLAAPADAKNLVEQGYANGVPMGGMLKGPGKGTPSFTLWASKEPDGATSTASRWSRAGLMRRASRTTRFSMWPGRARGRPVRTGSFPR
jgi:hypothetical protein